MLNTWIFLALLVSTPEISFEAPEPIGVFLNLPTKSVARVGVSPLLDGLTRRFHLHTGLTPFQVDAAALRACAGDVACAAEGTRNRIEGARFLLIVSNFSRPGAPDTLTASLIDVKAAKISAQGQAVEVSGQADLERYLERLFERHLKPALLARGLWAPFGSIEVSTDVSPTRVALDQRVLGTSSEGAVRIFRVPVGRHVLRVQRKGQFTSDWSDQAEVELEVQPGDPLPVRVEFRLSSTPELGLFYGSAAVGALGLGLTLWATIFAAQAASKNIFCEDGCTTPKFWTLEQMVRGVPPAEARAANEGRVLGLPLGYSLALAGGLSALITALWIKQDQDLWIPALIGAAVGGLTYGLSAL